MRNRQVILLGNGINRSFEKVSWKDIIEEIITVMNSNYTYEQIKGLPFNMQIVAASNDHVDEAMKLFSSKMAKDEIGDEQRRLLNRYLSLSFDEIVTTNYTFEIEQALGCPAKTGVYKLHVHYIKECTEREKQFGLYKYFEINGRRIWHIHGDIVAPRSVIMGQYYYGKALRGFEDYIAGMMRRYKPNPETFTPHNWLDNFMIGDVHIIGLGMDFSELDLWWLIACKKRNIPDTKIYFYLPSCEEVDLQKDIMLKIYGVEVVIVKAANYSDYYEYAANVVKENVTQGEK